MALIRGSTTVKSLCLLVLFLFFTGSRLFAQAAPILLSAEIAALEKKASDSKLSSPERKQALEKMARLFELSGNAERAAAAWGEAALAAVPGAGDLADLLQSGRCLAAIGDFDKAEAVIRPVLAASDKVLLVKARLLAAWIEAFKTGQTEALNALLSNPDFSGYKPGIYYAIRRISGASETALAARLLTEFPQSPEARIVRNDGPVNASPAVFWLLTGQPVSTGRPVEEAVPSGVSSRIPSGVPSDAYSDRPVILQTGLFSREENARALAERLRNNGFTPVVSKKTVSGKEHWIVGVEPGSNPSQTMLLLKDKGFESFPVF
jgi:cell division septation protein DedD